MRLLRVELTRFRSRRAVVLMLVAAGLLAAFLAGSTAWETRPVSDSDMARAQQQAEADAQSRFVQRDLRQCREEPRQWGGPGTTAADCEQMIMPQPEWYLDRSQLSLREEMGDTGLAVAILVTGILVIVGTTFAGADWASGSMSNQLLFRPRRAQVWLAKAAAVTLGATVAAAVVIGGFWLALYLVAESRDLATGATVQQDIRWTAARGALLAGFGALGGFAATMLLRHTVGTLAALFAYVVGGEAVIAVFAAAGSGRWSPATNVFGWLRDGYEYFDPNQPCPTNGDMCNQMVPVSLAQSGAYLAAVLVLVALVSLVSFRRRDVP
jgi:ABC-2 type transport system permease protein